MKPKIENVCAHYVLFFFDSFAALVFQISHIYYFTTCDFSDENDHVLHVLIGAGFTTIVLVYSFTDGVRFLRSNFDKLLYLISCILMKPILLPLLMPGRFRSSIGIKHIETHSYTLHRDDHHGRIEEVKILPTNFLLAV